MLGHCKGTQIFRSLFYYFVKLQILLDCKSDCDFSRDMLVDLYSLNTKNSMYHCMLKFTT